MSIKSKILSRQFMTRGIMFASIGAIGTVLNLAILQGLTTYAHVYYVLSELVAIIIMFAFNYVGNIFWATSKSKAMRKSPPGKS